jgi:hypothetical protein
MAPSSMLERIPQEVWDNIFQACRQEGDRGLNTHYLGGTPEISGLETLKAVRSTCRLLCSVVTPSIFSKIGTTLVQSWQHLLLLSQSRVAQYVRKLSILRICRSQPLMKFRPLLPYLQLYARQGIEVILQEILPYLPNLREIEAEIHIVSMKPQPKDILMEVFSQAPVTFPSPYLKSLKICFKSGMSCPPEWKRLEETSFSEPIANIENFLTTDTNEPVQPTCGKDLAIDASGFGLNSSLRSELYPWASLQTFQISNADLNVYDLRSLLQECSGTLQHIRLERCLLFGGSFMGLCEQLVQLPELLSCELVLLELMSAKIWIDHAMNCLEIRINKNRTRKGLEAVVLERTELWR